MSVNDAGDPFSPSSDLGHPADVILRSSDLVDFYTHKTILSFASPVFANMFTFPQPVSEADSTRDGRPVVHLSESSKAVEKFLILCYPRFTNSDGFRDLNGVDGAYEAAGKYDIQGGQKLLEQLLTKPRFLEKEPHRIFAIACRRGLEDLAKAAAMETLKFMRYASAPPIPEFKFVTAHQFQQLQEFHCRCSDMIVQMLEEIGRGGDVEWWYSHVRIGTPVPRLYQTWSKFRATSRGHTGCCWEYIDKGNGRFGAPDWFSKHIERAQESAALNPNAASASKSLRDIYWQLDFDCTECRIVGPGLLSTLAWALEKAASRAYADILAQFSFVG